MKNSMPDEHQQPRFSDPPQPIRSNEGALVLRQRTLSRKAFVDIRVVRAMSRSLCIVLLLWICCALSAQNEEHRVRNIVLVHGAWVDGSGWKGVHDLLVKKGYNVSIVQEPLTSFQEDVAATKRILDLQPGPCILVGHSYGGSVITEAGIDPHVVGLVYVAAHAPDVGEDEGELGKRMPSVLAGQKGAIKETADGFTFLNPADFPVYFAPDLPREQAVFESRSQVLAASKVFNTPLTAAAWKTKPSWAVVPLADKIINPNLEKWYYERARSHTIEIPGASHSVYESHPKEVAAQIEEAASHAR
jgi:pimeloyl-ACP methyl ester carboxylesterase